MLRHVSNQEQLWRRYDLALVAQPSDRAHLYGFVASSRRSGIVLPGLKSWWQRRLLIHVVEVPPGRGHVVLEKLTLLSPWAAAPAEVVAVPPRADALPEALLRSLQPCYVVVQVPSLVAYKQWPLAHFKRLVAGLVADGRQVVLTGSSSDADRAKVAEVAAGVLPTAAGAPAQVLDAAGQLDLPQVASLLTGTSLYIGPDTSITHLAAACRVPMIALYGPVDPCIFGPWPQGHALAQPWLPSAGRQSVASITLLQGSQPCVPCNGAGCEGHNNSRSDCLLSIDAERVLAEAKECLNRASA